MPEGEVVEVWPPKTAHLLHHKPSKAQVRRAKASSPPPPTPPPPSSGPSQRPMASSSAPPSSSGVTPPVAPKKSFLRRAVPFLLAANVVVGAYVYLRTNKKETAEGTEVLEEAPAAAAVSHAVPAVSTDTASPAVSTAAAAQEKAPVIQAAVSVAAATNILPSISENDQRQLFKWILEEKRKVKATSADEKKKIDEEKALLKHYVRLGSIPSL